MPWTKPVYIAPTFWDRVRGYRHHNCEYCLDAARFPHLGVFHPPDYPPPPSPPMPSRSLSAPQDPE